MYEFINATGDENQLEEFYDLVQASLNLLQIRNFTLQEIQEAEQKHIEKLRKRGWNI
nr:MAG TPA: triphosphate pyrophosphohydrolase [Caudoviricetes sp.]